MTDKSYTPHVMTFAVLVAILTIFVFLLVENHRDTPERVHESRSQLLSGGTGMSLAERIKPVGRVHMAASEPGDAPLPTAAATAAPARDGRQVYDSACVACHGGGIAGAPKLGDKAQWAKRIAKGTEALYGSAINGFQGSTGVMPPKGGNLALSDGEVEAAVDYMLAQSR